jgi:hypothetical protein
MTSKPKERQHLDRTVENRVNLLAELSRLDPSAGSDPFLAPIKHMKTHQGDAGLKPGDQSCRGCAVAVALGALVRFEAERKAAEPAREFARAALVVGSALERMTSSDFFRALEEHGRLLHRFDRISRGRIRHDHALLCFGRRRFLRSVARIREELDGFPARILDEFAAPAHRQPPREGAPDLPVKVVESALLAVGYEPRDVLGLIDDGYEGDMKMRLDRFRKRHPPVRPGSDPPSPEPGPATRSEKTPR